MSTYPECDKLAEASKQTQVIGEFLDWLATQHIQLMTWREDLTDSRPTGPDCDMRTRENREDPCWPTHESDLIDGEYYRTHCLHWHGKMRVADDDIAAEAGACCWCLKGRHYEVTGLQAWVHDSRSYEQLLADWAGIDLVKVEAERRQMLASLSAANARREGDGDAHRA